MTEAFLQSRCSGPTNQAFPTTTAQVCKDTLGHCQAPEAKDEPSSEPVGVIFETWDSKYSPSSSFRWHAKVRRKDSLNLTGALIS